MKEKIIGMILLTLLITTSFSTITAVNLNNVKNESIYPEILDGGWLEEKDGVRILHLNGSNYNMGFQHGFLVADSVVENYRALKNSLEQSGWPSDKVLEIWEIMDDYLPTEYKIEMQGIADGSGLDFEDILIINMIPALANHIFLNMSCCGISLWGDATEDGRLYHVRGFDGDMTTIDPISGRHLQENLIIIVRTPENGYASVAPEFAGHVGDWNGINEMEISVSETTVLTKDITFEGISAFFRMRMVLDYASTAEEAIEILNSNRTCGWNFIVSDGKIPVGYVIEQSANLTYVGTWDNPNEDINPFWKIKNIVRRTPMFISPELVKIEYGRPFYNPSGLKAILLAIFGISYSIFGWAHYKALSKLIDQRYGTFNLNNTMATLREEYQGKTDILMKLAMLFSGYIPVYQYVVCPSTGEIKISIASRDIMAHEDEIPIHYFNMYDLLNSTPP